MPLQARQKNQSTHDHQTSTPMHFSEQTEVNKNSKKVRPTKADLHKVSQKLSALLEKYMFYLEYERNVSPKTRENYSLWIGRLILFL